MRTRTLGTALVAAALALVPAAVADAHVTLHPNAVPAEGFTVLNVTVPNEQDAASTTKVEVQLPPGFAFASTAVVPGWTAKQTTSKLATPIKTDDGEIDTQVDTVTWTAEKGGGLPPGHFGQFPISVRIPGKAGDLLTFKTVQTYSNGEVSRWIGAPGSDAPAPQVAVTEADDEVEDYPAGAPGTAGHSHADAAEDDHAGSGSAATASDDHGDDDDHGDTLALIALVVSAAGLLVAGYAVMAGRRKRA